MNKGEKISPHRLSINPQSMFRLARSPQILGTRTATRLCACSSAE